MDSPTSTLWIGQFKVEGMSIKFFFFFINHVGACTALQTTVLHMKRFNETESPSPIFVILCVLCFQRQSFLTYFTLL